MEMLVGALLVTVALVSKCQAHSGTTQCPAVNKSIPEGYSEMIMPNISSYNNSILLCKKKHSSSVCDPIANVKNGKLTYYNSAYKEHFNVLENDLVVENASRFLTGEYQLKYQLSEKCLQLVFLYVLGSNPPNYGAIAGGVVAAVAVVVAVPFAFWWKQRRGRPAHPSTGDPDLGNEPLRPMVMETEGTIINIPNGESGIAANGML